MNVRRVLSPECVVLDLRSETKEAVLHELVDALQAAGRITDRDAALKAVFERERKMSTGLQDGIAVPHGKTDTVEGLVAVFGRKVAGIDFDSLDGRPARLFLLTLSPVARTGPHIQFLAEMSRTLHDMSTREQILASADAEQVLQLLWGAKAGERPS